MQPELQRDDGMPAEAEAAGGARAPTYLPGLVRGEGIDGRRITVRHLLQQTSGLPNYSDYLGDDVRYYAPRELLATALRHPADFAPGTSWKYSNTNYVLAGLISRRSPAVPWPRRSTGASSDQPCCATPTSPLPVTRASGNPTPTATTGNRRTRRRATSRRSTPPGAGRQASWSPPAPTADGTVTVVDFGIARHLDVRRD